MNQSTNYNFNLPVGTDLVNILTQLIPNWSSLDTILKGVENQAFSDCTEVVSLGVHALSRSNSDGKILRWIATANYTAGDTFTVDGNLVAAATASGEALATNAIVSGAVIIASLNADESAMTIFVTGTNVAADSAKLGGELPSYYAKDSDMTDAKQDITDLDNLMGNTSIASIGDGTVTGATSSLKSDLPNVSKIEVTGTSTETRSQLLTRLLNAIDFTLVGINTKLVINNTTVCIAQYITNDDIWFANTLASSNRLDINTLKIKTAEWYRYDYSSNASHFTNLGNENANGLLIELWY